MKWKVFSIDTVNFTNCYIDLLEKRLRNYWKKPDAISKFTGCFEVLLVRLLARVPVKFTVESE